MESTPQKLHNQTVLDNTKYYHKRPRTHTFDIGTTNVGSLSSPMNAQPSALAATPADAVPAKGSITSPTSWLPAALQTICSTFNTVGTCSCCLARYFRRTSITCHMSSVSLNYKHTYG